MTETIQLVVVGHLKISQGIVVLICLHLMILPRLVSPGKFDILDFQLQTNVSFQSETVFLIRFFAHPTGESNINGAGINTRTWKKQCDHITRDLWKSKEGKEL